MKYSHMFIKNQEINWSYPGVLMTIVVLLFSTRVGGGGTADQENVLSWNPVPGKAAKRYCVLSYRPYIRFKQDARNKMSQLPTFLFLLD